MNFRKLFFYCFNILFIFLVLEFLFPFSASFGTDNTDVSVNAPVALLMDSKSR